MSEIRATTISDSAGTGPITLTGQYTAKAWITFDGTDTLSILESGNSSSVTDDAVGMYTYTLTSAMANSNFSASTAASSHTNTSWANHTQICLYTQGATKHDPTTTTLKFHQIGITANAYYDTNYSMLQIVGDLA